MAAELNAGVSRVVRSTDGTPIAVFSTGPDSGAPLVDPDGNVIGVAFAIAPDRASTAYALDTIELNAVLDQERSGRVSTGPCVP